MADSQGRETATHLKTLLDTNVCVAILNRDLRVHDWLLSRRPSALRMSAITLAELRFGVAKSNQAKRATANLRLLLSKVGVVPFDEAATVRHGDLRASLERRGSPIGPLDTLIAAHALALAWPLATRNSKEFRRVPGLKVTNPFE